MPEADTARKSPLATLGVFAASGLATTALQFLVRLGKNVLFTRLLGPEGRGLYALLMTIPTLVTNFGSLGFGMGSFYVNTKEKVDLRVVMGNGLVFTLVQGGVLLLVGWLVFGLQSLTGGGLAGADVLKPYVLAAIPLLLFHNLVLDLLVARTDIHFFNLLRLLFSLLPLVLFGVLYVFLDMQTALFSAWVGSIGLIGLFAFVRLLRNGAYPLGFSLRKARDAFQFGLRGYFGPFANSVVRRVDVLFLAHYCGAEVVGQYAVAVSLAEILLTLPEVIATPFLAMRMNMDDSSGYSFSPLICKYLFAVMTLVCLATALLAMPAIRILFGKDFSPSFQPLLWLLPGIIALSVYGPAKAEILAAGKPEWVSMVALATMLLNILLNFIFVPLWGATGAACTSSISYAASCAVLLVLISRRTRIPLQGLLLLNVSEGKQLFRSGTDYLRKKRRRYAGGDCHSGKE